MERYYTNKNRGVKLGETGILSLDFQDGGGADFGLL